MSGEPSYDALVDELSADPEFSAGQMMGMPALKIGSKMFGGLFEGNLTVKVGKERVQELIDAGRAQPFDPSGRDRPMKDWALVGPGDDWLALAEEAKALTRSA